jgi:hypothetical protein
VRLVGSKRTADPGVLGRDDGADVDCEQSSSLSSSTSEEEEEVEETLLLEAMFQYVDGMEAADSLERGDLTGVMGGVLGVFSHGQIGV